MSEFKWTDELVDKLLKSLGYTDASDRKSTIMFFKKSKQQTQSNKDWEIESYKNKYGSIHHSGKAWDDFNTIHSVRRLSDGEVFSIGDKIDGFGGTPIITIDRFEIDTFDKNRITAYHKNGYGKSSSAWEKVKQPLFKTEDGIDIYEGDKYWVVNRSFGIATSTNREIDQSLKYFSTETQAQQYVLDNKPCISLNDVVNVCYAMQPSIFRDSPLYLKLKELAQQKINNTK